MPRKNAMRDNVNVVRSRLPYLSDLPREKIELALLYYEANVDETVQAFERNGAVEALGGWTEMNNGRGNNLGKRINNRNTQPLRLNTTSSLQIPPSNGILRPSQRVSNIFQTFAEGGTPIVATNGSSTISTTTTTCSPSSISSSSFIEQSDNNSQSNSYLSHDPITHDPQDAIDTSTTINNVIPEETLELSKPTKSQRRRSVKNRNSSTSSMTQNHEIPSNQQTTTTGMKSSNSSAFTSNNKKILTKSAKDLQRQTSTLSNVELLFNNEIKSSMKRIDDIFKQIYEVMKEREVQLYLEMDKVKEQGLNVIHRRQQRGVELRQRVDRCDRLEPLEIDNLRHDIKQFVTDRRYDLCEELTSSHRFEYDQTLTEALKTFGTVLRVDRKQSVSTAAPLLETTTDISLEKVPVVNGRTALLSSSSNDIVFTDNQPEQHQQPLPQRVNKKQSNGDVIHSPTNGNVTGDFHQNIRSSSQSNGYMQYYDDPNSYQKSNRRRTQQHSQGSFQRPRPPLNYQNGNNRRNVPQQINARSHMYPNSETTPTYRRPRPSPHPSQSIVPVQT